MQRALASAGVAAAVSIVLAMLACFLATCVLGLHRRGLRRRPSLSGRPAALGALLLLPLLLLFATPPVAAVTPPPPPPPPSPPPDSSLCQSAIYSPILCFDSDYYPFGPSTTWVDRSGHTNLSFYYYNNPTTTAWTPTVTPSSSSGSGISFPGGSTGSGYYALASTDVTISTSFTFITRIWPNSVAGGVFLWTLNRSPTNVTYEAAMEIGHFGDSTTIGTGFGTAIPNGNAAPYYIPSFPAGQWSHYAFVRSGLYGYYYLNGVLVTNVTATTSVTYGTSNFAIGCDYRNLLMNGTPRCFSGYMSTFMILNSALNGSQILSDYTTGASAPRTRIKKRAPAHPPHADLALGGAF